MDTTRLCARDLMQGAVKTVTQETGLLVAAKTMHDSQVSSLVVERSDAQDALGIITRKDMVEAATSFDGDSETLLVEHIMTKPAITVAPDLSIGHCLQMMRMVYYT